jgi:hypothetical protein
MDTGHFIEYCVCGNYKSQCRCIGPKETRIRQPCTCPNPGQAARQNPAKVTTPAGTAPVLVAERAIEAALAADHDFMARRTANRAAMIAVAALYRDPQSLNRLAEDAAVMAAAALPRRDWWIARDDGELVEGPFPTPQAAKEKLAAMYDPAEYTVAFAEK